MNKQEAINALKEHNQEHVIKRLEALDEVSAKKLIAQVASKTGVLLKALITRQRTIHLIEK